MRTVALGDVVDFYSGGTPSKSRPEYWEGSIPWISAKDMKKPRLADATDHISDSVFASTSLRRVSAGTVILVVRGMILAHTIPVAILDVDAAINQDLKALIPRRDLDPSFLSAMLRAQEASILTRVGTAAHGTKKLESRVLNELRIPFPSLDEQRRIAAILDHADALRTKRRQVLAHLDTLTQSIFHEMFGDPDEPQKTFPFGEVATLTGGRNLVADDSESHSLYRVLKISAVTTGQFKSQESKPLPVEYVPPSDHLVRSGDLLMSRANTTELVGATAYVHEAPPNVALPDKIWRFNWRTPECVPLYFHALFQTPSIRRRISRLASGTGGSMKNVSKGKLESMLIPVPPVLSQLEFATRAEVVHAQRRELRHLLDADDELFASLQSRAFRGEL